MPCRLPPTPPACRRRLLQLLRFHSSKSPDKLTSLAEYVARMKEGQKHIYYLVGECGAFGASWRFCSWLVSVLRVWCELAHLLLAGECAARLVRAGASITSWVVSACTLAATPRRSAAVRCGGCGLAHLLPGWCVRRVCWGVGCHLSGLGGEWAPPVNGPCLCCCLVIVNCSRSCALPPPTPAVSRAAAQGGSTGRQPAVLQRRTTVPPGGLCFCAGTSREAAAAYGWAVPNQCDVCAMLCPLQSAGTSREEVEKSPFVESLVEKGYEVGSNVSLLYGGAMAAVPTLRNDCLLC